MSEAVLDFRSDTVTRPSEAMRRAMAEALVGDDVYDDDPTVRELQDYAADLLGKPAALFACSGTMANLLGVLTQTRRGDGAILGAQSHIYFYEAGGLSALAGVLPHLVDDASGLIAPEAVRSAFRDGNVHFASSRLLCLENTHNRAGGAAFLPEEIGAAADEARSLGMAVHLDGARLFNAAEACGRTPREYADRVDTVQICLSKGLGAPMGSLLLGPVPLIQEARHWRKRLGGGQRQVGIVAAGGLYALRHNVGRLAEDHRNAARLAEGLAERGFGVEPVGRRTNMVYFRVRSGGPSAPVLAERCAARGLLFGAVDDSRVRMVCHLDVDAGSVERALLILAEEASR